MKEAEYLAHSIFNTYGFPLLIVLIAALLLLETRQQLHRRVQPRWPRALLNLATAIPSLGVLRLVFIPLMVWLAMQNGHWHIGLNYLYQLPHWAEAIIAFIALDYLVYLWHVLAHKVPLLWRFHQVHHTDRDLDVSTAIRFHFGELVMFAIYLGAAVLLTGASPLVVLVYEICFEACTNFHHSNWRLPLRVEKWLNIFIITPRMHHLHHSVLAAEKNSNWGTIFSWWDRLHCTHSVYKNGQYLQVGEAAYPDQKQLTIFKLLVMPFQKIRR